MDCNALSANPLKGIAGQSHGHFFFSGLEGSLPAYVIIRDG
jgi:hypothetical protein